MNNAKIAILGDSRTFDTYYYNSQYKEHYGYDKTFPFLLQKAVWADSGGAMDVVHIPDHFRSRSIENNILRLALTDPLMVIMCNGIWETLLTKQIFMEYAEAKKGEELKLTYNSRMMADLFKSNELSTSPKKYFSEQRQIISYFRRRQRRCVLMALPVPPPAHLGGLHYAGNYHCPTEWGECLETLNDVIKPLERDYGVSIADLHNLIIKNGDFGKNLIDQWHFSASFHALLADYFKRFLKENSNLPDIPKDHISHEFMLHRDIGRHTLLVYGTGAAATDWVRDHPGAGVEASVSDAKDIKKAKSKIILSAEPQELRQESEVKILRDMPKDKILLYPEELDGAYYKSLKGM
ncbi:MAG: hypothetical protein PHI59_09700 [Candidatus Omnitrophica bacterium]|nr:hypothetical protein [Candidatus Omnitrophota bacterium]